MVKSVTKIIHIASVFALKQEMWLAMAHKHQTAIIMLTTKWVRPFSDTYWILFTPTTCSGSVYQAHLGK